MDKVYVIRHKVLIEGLSQREVARQLGIDKETVAKYLKVSAPQRVEPLARKRPVAVKVERRIAELMEEWRGRTTAKQRITATRLYRQLQAEGFTVGITTVKECLREKRRQAAEVYIPLLYQAGEVAQVDFFEVTVEVEGQSQKVWQFVMRLQYSGFAYVWLYEQCNQLSFLDAHVRAFTVFKGIPARLVYDNLGLAVRRVMGAERELTERFKALASHYLYEPCFTRVGQGHDKGGVESGGKNIRLQQLVPIPRGPSLPVIAETLLTQLQASYPG